MNGSLKTKHESKLTLEQQAQIYCIKNGHANFVWSFFGYVHCGRCSTQIGDTLGGIFDTTNVIAVGHKCDTCNSLKKKLSKMDRIILGRLEKDGSKRYDYEKILDGINFG